MLFGRISPQINNVVSFQKDITPENYTHNKYTCVYELIIIVKGSILFCDNENEERCEAGDVIYLPARCDYSTTFPCEPVQVINLGFDMVRRTNESRNFTRNFILRGKDLPREEGCFAEVVKFDDRPCFNKSFVLHNMSGAVERAKLCKEMFASQSDPFSLLRLNMQIVEFLIDIAEKMDSNHPKKRSESISDNVIEYIEKHCSEKLTCAKVAEDFSYHPASLNRIMKETRGISLHKAILNAKINFSVHLLLETNMSIAEIAQQLYFYDSAHFTKSFQSVTGHSPSYFRKNDRNI
jgi:AraC-like DNA-binding protein